MRSRRPAGRPRCGCRRVRCSSATPPVRPCEIAPTATPAATTILRSKPAGGTSFCTMRAVLLEPEPVLERAEMAPERDLVVAKLDVAPPAAETRLDDDRAFPVVDVPAGMEDVGARVRQARALQDLRRQQLVVRREQRSGAVEHDDTPCRKRAERPETVFDAVEPLSDVEPAQRDGSRLQQRRRLLRDENSRIDPVRRGRGEGRVRRSTTLGDDREQHDFRYRRESAIRGLWEGEDPGAVWCAATGVRGRRACGQRHADARRDRRAADMPLAQLYGWSERSTCTRLPVLVL